jgi:hypothetical protein
MPPRHDASRREKFRYEYGAGPLHLIAVIASLLLSGYGILRINDIDNSVRVFIWILACALFHDLIALPFYSVLLRIARIPAGAAFKTRALALHAYNHIRVPIAWSLLLLLVYFPLIFRMAPDEYLATTGRSVDVYLGRWLLLSAAGFVISGILYAIGLRRGVPQPEQTIAPRPADEESPPVGLVWRIGSKVVLTGSAVAILWVAAALVVGLLTTGITP